MSDGGRWPASLGTEMSKSSQNWSVQQSAVRSIAWLDLFESMEVMLPEGPLATEDDVPSLSTL